MLGTSQAFARTQVQRGLATLHQDLPTGGARCSPAWTGARRRRPPISSVRRPPPTRPPRRRGRTAWVAAVAVLTLVVTVALVAHATRTPAGVITYPSVHVPTDWRYESYDGVQVQVPADWGFGGAPIAGRRSSSGRLGACGANQAAVLSAADRRVVRPVGDAVRRPARR